MKGKIKKILAVAGLMIGSLFTATQVNAENASLTINHSGYWWTRTSPTEASHSWYTEDYYFGDRVAYCIQPGVTEGTDNYIIGNWDNTGYTNEVKEKVLLMAYYGYDYPGHQNLRYKLATQALIWETVGNYKITYSTGRWDTGTIIDVSAERNEIMSLVNTHYNKPSFNGQTLAMKVGETITLTDTNGVLSNYDVILSNNAESSINGNNLTIKATNVGDIKIQFKKKLYTSREYLVYYGDDIQNMVSSGAVDPVYASVNVTSTGGKVEFNKKDSDTNTGVPQGEASLNDAEYGVYDKTTDALISTVKTNSDGYGVLEHLPYFGEFYLKEITPSKGYQLDTTKYYFTSSIDNIDNQIVVKEKVINRDIEITKVYATDESKIMTPESNVKFSFYDSNNKLYKEATTDKYGRINVNLVYGTYTVKQLTTSKDTTKIKDFKIEVYEMGDKLIYTVSNAEIKAKLKVIKVDKDTGEVIKRSGIKFKILDTKTNEYICQKVTYPKATTLCEFETDNEGVLITPYPLNSGTYKLEEVDQAIDGYLWNKESVEFTIGENAELITDNEYGILFETNFENKSVLGEINIHKTGEEVELTDNGYTYSKIDLEGVKIGLYANDNIYSTNGKLMYDKDTLIGTYTTDSEGNIKIEDLYLGEYYLKELETVKGHVLDDTKYVFELKYKDQYTEIITKDIEVDNHLPKGTIEFTKADFSTSETLPNTLIEIYTDKDELVYSGRTDENGKITIDNLPVGKYYILEKEAPEGYELNENKMEFEIKEDGEVVKCTMTDDKIVEVPNTNKNDILPLGMKALIILGLGCVIYGTIKNKRRKK